jgi:hypothetical protein
MFIVHQEPVPPAIVFPAPVVYQLPQAYKEITVTTPPTPTSSTLTFPVQPVTVNISPTEYNVQATVGAEATAVIPQVALTTVEIANAS